MKVTCPCCGSNFATWSAKVHSKQPILLNCGHTFCESCIAQTVKKITTSHLYQAQATCSTCKTVTFMESGIKDLPVNVYLLAYIELNQRGKLEQQLGQGLGQFVPAKKKQPPVSERGMCKICVTKIATCQCVECDSTLCKSCFGKVHSISESTKQHKPVPVSVSKLDIYVEPKCAEHNRVLEYFCEDDCVSICSRCYIVGSHQNHSITSFEEKNKEVLEEIENELPKAKLVLQNLNKVKRKVASLVPNVKTETRSLIESISQSFLKLHALLQIREVEIVNSIYSIYKDKFLSLDQHQESLDKIKSDLEDAVKKSDKLFEDNSLLLDGNALLETLRKAKSTPCVVVKADNSVVEPLQWNETNSDSLAELIKAYGSVTGTPLLKLDFKTIEEAPDCVDDDDKASVNSLSSETSVQTQGGIHLAAGYASSVDNGEDVIIEHEDVESETAKTSQRTTVESKDKQLSETEQPESHSSSERGQIALPVVKGPAQKAVVTHIRSPTDFYIQLASNKRQLKSLENSINFHCRKSGSAKDIPTKLEKGMLVLARYTADKQWYRARVTSIEKPADNTEDGNIKVHVEYIDFGNDEVLPIKELRIMQHKFKTYPAFSVHCSLFDIAPYKEDETWSVESIREFHQMTQNQVLLLTTLNAQGHVFEVDLCCIPQADMVDDNYISVRDILIFLELARFKVFSSAAVNASAPPAYPKINFIKPTPVKNGKIENVIVTEVTSPWDLHLVVIGEEYDYYLSMHGDMQEQYGNDACNMYSMFYPRPGIVCAAKGKDDKWHRAKVSSAPVHKEVTVNLVDLGTTETVSYDRLKKLHSSFIKLPIQAIPCRLLDVCPLAGPLSEWSYYTKLWCQDVMTGVSGSARFVKCDSDIHIVLWLESSDSMSPGQSINYTLVENDLAQSTGPSSLKVAVEPKTNESLTAVKCGSYSQKTSYNSDITSHPASTETGNKFYKNKSPQAVSDSVKHKLSRHPKAKTTPKAQTRTSTRAKKTDRIRSNEEKQKIHEEISKALCSDSTHPTRGSDANYIEVVVCNYVSPSEFYVQVLETQEELTRLMKDMQDLYSGLEPSSREWSVNEYCAAKYSVDGIWYRGNIMSKVSDEDYQVELVDFGNTELVKCCNLQPLRPELGNRIPCAAARCFLANLLPAGSMNLTKWSQTAVEFMASLLKDRKMYIKQEGDPTENGLPVDLIMEEEIPETAFEPKSQTYHSMQGAILDKGLALPRKGQPSSPPDSPGVKPFQRFILTEKTGQATAPCITEQDELVDSSKSSSVNTSPNVACLVAEDEDLNLDEFSEAVESEHDKINALRLPTHPLPKSGVEIDVVPTYVDKQGVIYVQPKDWEGKCLHQSSELQRIYQQMPPSVDTDWKPEQMCVAVFPDDGLWYRAQVQEVKDDAVKVQYIDFGNSVWVRQSHLHKILPGFTKVHALAYRCVLHDLEPLTPTKVWPKEVLKHIHELIVNFSCSIIAFETEEGAPLNVQLFRDDMNLAMHLISSNLAKSHLNMKRMSEQSNLIGQVLANQNPYRQLDIGAVGDTFRAIMVHVELPNLVYLQHSIEVEPDDTDFVKASEVAENNTNISDFIEFAERLKSCKCMPVTQLPDVGLMCAALFSADDELYRALCVQCFLETDSCLVVYVDYGTSEVVPRSRLRLLPSQFWSFPAQAIRCHINLPYSSESDEYLSHDSISVIQSLTKQELMARIVTKAPLTVELFVHDGGKWRVPHKECAEINEEKFTSRENAFARNEAECVDVTKPNLSGDEGFRENWNDESDDESFVTSEEEQAKDAECAVTKLLASSKESSPTIKTSPPLERRQLLAAHINTDDIYDEVD